MNRKILFKAKRKDNGEWIEGYYVYCRKRHYILPVLNKAIGFDEREDEWVEVNPDTICQYTGLTDKNGKRIWENDICDRKEKYHEIVTYNEGDWQLDYSYALGKEKHFCACNLGFYACERECVEVIGNVFDNPELLEV